MTLIDTDDNFFAANKKAVDTTMPHERKTKTSQLSRTVTIWGIQSPPYYFMFYINNKLMTIHSSKAHRYSESTFECCY